MTAPTPLEDRLRRGLRAAAEALPDAPLEPPAPSDGRVRSSHRLRLSRLTRGDGGGRRWVPLAAAVAVVTAVVTALVVSDRPGGSDRDPSDVRVASPGEGTEAPREVRQANGRVPGQAMVFSPDQGTSELRTFGPDGAPTGTVDLAPLERVQAASSDLEGGWVACGFVWEELPPDDPEERAEMEEAMETVPTGPGRPGRETTTTVTLPVTTPGGASPPPTEAQGGVTSWWVYKLMWFPAGREPVVLEPPDEPECTAGPVQVVDSAEGPTLLYPDLRYGIDPRLHALVLATGEHRELPVLADATRGVNWSASTGRMVVVSPDGRLALHDLAGGDELPIAPIDAPPASEVVLSPDARSAAVLIDVAADTPEEVVVYDLATGAERFRETFDLDAAQLSYDGTTLAVGDVRGGDGLTVTVIDLATGDRRTLPAQGTLL